MTASPAAPDTDFAALLAALRSRAWLILLLTAAVAGAGYALSDRLPRDYEATAVLLFRDLNLAPAVFGSAVTQGNPERDAQTNVRLVELERVRSVAGRRFGLTAEGVSEAISVVPEGESDLISITATSSKARRASRLANAVANAALDLRREQVVGQIEDAERRLRDEVENVPEGTTRSERRQRRRELANLGLLRSIQTGGVELAQEAEVPRSPEEADRTQVAVLGGLAGFLLGVAIAFVLEFRRRPLRRLEDLEEVFAAPVLASSVLAARNGKAAKSREAYERLLVELQHEANGTGVAVTVIGAGAARDASKVAHDFARTARRVDQRVLLLKLGQQDRPAATPDGVEEWRPESDALVSVETLRTWIRQALTNRDVVVVDAEGGLDTARGLAAMSATDQVLVVVRRGLGGGAAEAASRELRRFEVRPTGLVEVRGRAR